MANESMANGLDRAQSAANEAKIFEPRDDDPDDVSDKLSIAAAMWGRGDGSDALSWLRRAAESASDADLDARALELAKAASDLAARLDPAPASAPASAAAPSPKPQTAPPAKPAPAAMPPASRPPGSKLPPLPPLRPLGSAPEPASKAGRIPSMITSVSGLASASGTVDREPIAPEPARASAAPTRPMPWDEIEREAAPAHPAVDPDATATHDAVDPGPPAPTPAARATTAPESDGGRITLEPRPLPLAIGLRVRLVPRDGAVLVVPEDESQDGVVAIVVPANADDDLRAVFARARA